jgi:hypothetical protein
MPIAIFSVAYRLAGLWYMACDLFLGAVAWKTTVSYEMTINMDVR